MVNTESEIALHLRLVERGKMYSLEGNYKEALRHYREAIRMIQSTPGTEIFFQHYSQCVMEALELSGAYGEVITYCERFIDFLAEKEEQTPLVKKHHAVILEKQAIQYMLKEELNEALPLLKEAQSLAGRGGQPLTDDLLNWVMRGYKMTKKQIMDLQKKHNYFIVRKDKIRREIAMDLPEALKQF